MRSKLIIVATAAASLVLTAQMAAADPVQEQLRLMEQRMAEMEDRLQATSDELQAAKATVDEQQGLLSDAGLVSGGDEGIRSSVGNFMKEIDISGVAAASYNQRFLDSGDDNSLGGTTYFRHPDANTFAIDQIWLTLDKPVTEESRGGFHAEYVWGKSALAQGVNASDEHSGLLYTGYVSYLAPIGNGVEIDAGKLATPFGAEVVQTNQNFNITQSLVFGLQPVTHVGVSASTSITDELGLIVGVVNDVYTQNNFDREYGKAYYAQLSFATDMFGMNVGAIVGNDSTLGCTDADDDCYTSVLDVVMTADPSDEVSLWLNFDWQRTFGGRNKRNGTTRTGNGDVFGIAGAGRIALTDSTGFATRIEYVRSDATVNAGQLGEVLELTGTIDHALTEDLKLRIEARWDRQLDNGPGSFLNGQNGPANSGGAPATSQRDDQIVGLAEIYYEF